MTHSAFRSMLTAVLTVLTVTMLLVMTVLYNYFSSVQQTQLRTEAYLTAQGAEKLGISFFDRLNAGDNRITWISSGGDVLFDNRSDLVGMENHLEREEIQEALSAGYGESIRYSSTLAERQLYAAVRLSDGSVLRLSVAQNSILSLLGGMLPPIGIIALFAVILSFFLASRLAKRIVRPLNTLDLDHPLENTCYDELTPLLQRINAQQEELRNQDQALQRQKNELDTIINAMQEGMLLTDAAGGIVAINPKACALLQVSENCIGENCLTISVEPALHAVLHAAFSGISEMQTASIQSCVWSFMASPIYSEERIIGAAVMMIDITEKEKAEEIRREFTANVSHELKTPIHTISGYAELIADGIARQEDIQPFAQKIHGEAQRLARLISDIISLSHLDEGAADMVWEDVDLYAVVRSAVSSLDHEMKEAYVSISVTGTPAVMKGIPRLLESMVVNLCDNAIKYNHEGGTVNVSLKEQDTHLILTVADTGIGIPEEHIERIFERFYRVDKSHSRAIGGTGLGLSIVKHAASIHSAIIHVDSTPGKGSTFTVDFPKERQIDPTPPRPAA